MRWTSWRGFRVSLISGRKILFLSLMMTFLMPFAQSGADPVGAGVSGAASVSEVSEPSKSNGDPLEKMNRGIFWLNEKGDIYLVAPAARVWRWVTPSFVRTAVVNVNRLILMPAIFGNDIFQLKFDKAGEDFLRVVFNASFGLGGLIDVATMVDIPQNDEDFGQTLGYWGVPHGPYLMLPLFGPATVRDGVGRVVDSGATFYFTLLPIWGTFIIRGVDLLNLRSRYLEEVDESRRDAFDYYVFMREAYMQNRDAKVARARGEDYQRAADDDLYYFDDEELEIEEYNDQVERKLQREQEKKKQDNEASTQKDAGEVKQ